MKGTGLFFSSTASPEAQLLLEMGARLTFLVEWG